MTLIRYLQQTRAQTVCTNLQGCTESFSNCENVSHSGQGSMSHVMGPASGSLGLTWPLGIIILVTLVPACGLQVHFSMLSI